jgi:hypothetical protein
MNSLTYTVIEMAKSGKQSRKRSTGMSNQPEHDHEFAELIQTMIEQSGNPKNFDVLSWLTDWMNRPLPALGGAKPRSYMVTPEGRQLVRTLLLCSQSGAFV